MAKKGGKKDNVKGRRDAPSDQRRRAARDALKRVVVATVEPKVDYTPKVKPVSCALVTYPSATASELLAEGMVGVYDVSNVPGLRVEFLRDHANRVGVRILRLPESNSTSNAWEKRKDTFLLLTFIGWTKFVSKVPVAEMREVQQMIYDLLHPYWAGWKVQKQQQQVTPPSASPSTALALALGDIRPQVVLKSEEENADIHSFFKGVPGKYAFPRKGPKARFVVEDLNGVPGYRLVAVEAGNPLEGVLVPTMVSRNQVLGSAGIAVTAKKRGAVVLCATLLKFFQMFNLVGEVKERMVV